MQATKAFQGILKKEPPMSLQIQKQWLDHIGQATENKKSGWGPWKKGDGILEAGDSFTYKDKTSTLRTTDLSSQDAFDRFLENATGAKIDLLWNNSNSLQYLILRHTQDGIKIIDIAQNKDLFPAITKVKNPNFEEFNQILKGRSGLSERMCNDSTKENLEQLHDTLTQSAQTYLATSQEYEQAWNQFLNDDEVNESEMKNILSQTDRYNQAANQYQQAKASFYRSEQQPQDLCNPPHLPKRILEQLGCQFVDGIQYNAQDYLDEGDTITINGQSYHVTEADINTYEKLENFLSRITQRKVNILRDEQDRFQYLVDRYSEKIGGVKILNSQGINLARFSGYEEPLDERKIDRLFDDKYARCHGDRSCQNELQSLFKNLKDVAIAYEPNYRSFVREYQIFYNKKSLSHEDITNYLRSTKTLEDAADTYRKNKAAFANYIPQSSINLSESILKNIVQLRDGSNRDNYKNHVDEGDTIYQGYRSRKITGSDLESFDSLAKALSYVTSHKVQIVTYGNQLQYLVEITGSSLQIKIVDANGRNLAIHPRYQEPDSESKIDREFRDKHGRCYDDDSCENELHELHDNYKKSAENYKAAYKDLRDDYYALYRTWRIDDRDVENYLDDLKALRETEKYYLRDKKAFEDFEPSIPKPQPPAPPSDPIELPPDDPIELPPDHDRDGNNPDKSEDF